MMKINYLGAFDSLDAVWAAYPYGGKEGDYVIVAGEEIAWNKYTLNWGEAQGEETETEESKFFKGDVTIGKNLYVGGIITANGVRTPDKGLFATQERLLEVIPNPKIGFWAAVGDAFPADLWVCQTEGVWENTGLQYDGGEVILDNYARYEDVAQNLFVLVESESVLRQMLEDGNYDNTKVYYTLEEE